MPDKAPEGYTHIEDAVERWGRNRAWWYAQVKDARLVGYGFPGLRGTYLRDEDVERFITTPEQKRRDGSVDAAG